MNGTDTQDEINEFTQFGKHCHDVKTSAIDSRRITSYNVCYTKLLRKIKPMLTNIEEEDVEHPFASIQPTEIIVLRDRLTLHKIPKSINKVEEGKAIANYEYFASYNFV